MVINRINNTKFTQLLLPMVLCVCWSCASSQALTNTTETTIKEGQPQKVRTPGTTAAANQERATTKSAASTVERVYSGENQEHSIALVMDFGARIKLEDGSLWEINPSDRFKTREWLVTHRIKMVRGLFDRYPFRFTSVNKNTMVDAKLITSPF